MESGEDRQRSFLVELQARVAAMAGYSSVSYVSGQQLAGLQGPRVAVVDVRLVLYADYVSCLLRGFVVA